MITEYQKQHKWIEFKNGGVFCSYCTPYCEENNIQFRCETDKYFIKVGSTSIKKFNIERHCKRNVHCQAVLKYGSEDEKIDAQALLSQEKTSNLDNILHYGRTVCKDKTLLPLFKDVLYLVKNDHALYEFEDLRTSLN